MLQSCDYLITVMHNYIKGSIAVENPHNDAYNKKLAFKNDAPFISYIRKINNTLIDNKDLLMLMYNLIEYSKSYLKTLGILSNYCRDELNSGAEGNINYSIKG